MSKSEKFQEPTPEQELIIQKTEVRFQAALADFKAALGNPHSMLVSVVYDGSEILPTVENSTSLYVTPNCPCAAHIFLDMVEEVKQKEDVTDRMFHIDPILIGLSTDN
jgi:hypothetical protein